jgi:hypothetical protein
MYLRNPLLRFPPEAFRLAFGATGLLPKPIGSKLQGLLLGRLGLRVVVFVLMVRHGDIPHKRERLNNTGSGQLASDVPANNSSHG